MHLSGFCCSGGGAWGVVLSWGFHVFILWVSKKPPHAEIRRGACISLFRSLCKFKSLSTLFEGLRTRGMGVGGDSFELQYELQSICISFWFHLFLTLRAYFP